MSIFLHKMAEEFKRKAKIRGGHRASAKRIMTLAEESLTTFDPKNPDRVTKVKEQLATLKEKMKTLSEYDEAILNLIEEEEIPGEIEQADIFREKLQHCIVCIEATLEKVANVTSPVGHTTGGLPLSSFCYIPYCKFAKVEFEKIQWRCHKMDNVLGVL